MKYSFNFCHGSRTGGFSTSTIFVEASPPARLLLPVCSTSRRCAWRLIRLSETTRRTSHYEGGGIGARPVRTYRNNFSLTSWQRYAEVLRPRVAPPPSKGERG